MTSVERAEVGPDVRLVPAALTGWAATAAGILWHVGASVVAVLVAVMISSAAAWRVSGSAGSRAVVQSAGAGLVAIALVGGGFAIATWLRVHELGHHPVVDRYGSVTAVIVTPDETPRLLSGGRMMFRGSLHAVGGDEMSGRVVVFASVVGFSELATGRPAGFRARIGRPTRRDLTVAVLSATGQPTLGEAAPIHRLARHVRVGFTDASRAALPADQAAMLPALVLGDTSAVTGQTVAEFRESGLTHLTAVSGANVTIVCGAVLFTAVLVGPRVAVALAAVTLVAFVIVVEPSASVLRAAVMGGITLLAVVTHRRRQAIPALSATVLTLLIAAPELAVDVGFALSVSATAGLIVIAPVWSQRLTDRGWPKPLAAAVSVAVAAQLVTAPLVAGIAGTVSLVAVLANLVVAVVIPPITVMGTAAASLCTLWPAAAQLLIRFTGPALWWLLRVARWAADVPGASVPVPSGLVGVLTIATAGVVLLLMWRWRWVRLGVGGAAVCLLAWAVSGHIVGTVGPA